MNMKEVHTDCAIPSKSPFAKVSLKIFLNGGLNKKVSMSFWLRLQSKMVPLLAAIDIIREKDLE